MLTQTELSAMEYDKKYFIETDRAQHSYVDWLFSKGTNYSCYVQYMENLNGPSDLQNKINVIRTIIYAFSRPFSFAFFYWTLLIFILHKFNFKKPVMKILLIHYVVRCTGNVLDQLSGLFPRYYANTYVTDDSGNKIFKCIAEATASSERNPFKWFLTRQIGTICWYVGEIVADWYPLLRTKAVARDRSLWYVYASCGLFNISKMALIVYHFTLKPTELYNEEGVYNSKRVNDFYFIYWIIQLVIIYTSLIYDFTVFFVLRRKLKDMVHNEFGFLKKFRSISEFRILLSVIVSLVFLPIVSVTFFFMFYYHNKKGGYENLDLSFEEIRKLIANVQYYMIFIDQILLLRSNSGSSSNEGTYVSSCDYNNNKNNQRYLQISNNQNTMPLKYPTVKKYNDYNYSDNSSKTLSNKSSNPSFIEYNYDKKIDFTTVQMQNSNFGFLSNNYNTKNSKSKTLANYDDYNNKNGDWNFLK